MKKEQENSNTLDSEEARQEFVKNFDFDKAWVEIQRRMDADKLTPSAEPPVVPVMEDSEWDEVDDWIRNMLPGVRTKDFSPDVEEETPAAQDALPSRAMDISFFAHDTMYKASKQPARRKARRIQMFLRYAAVLLLGVLISASVSLYWLRVRQPQASQMAGAEKRAQTLAPGSEATRTPTGSSPAAVPEQRMVFQTSPFAPPSRVPAAPPAPAPRPALVLAPVSPAPALFPAPAPPVASSQPFPAQRPISLMSLDEAYDKMRTDRVPQLFLRGSGFATNTRPPSAAMGDLRP